MRPPPTKGEVMHRIIDLSERMKSGAMTEEDQKFATRLGFVFLGLGALAIGFTVNAGVKAVRNHR